MSRKRIGRVAMAAGTLVAGIVLSMGETSSAAKAAPGDTASDTTEARVVVTGAITLTDLTPSFTLTGRPRQTVDTADPVSFTVTTNNFAGYTVTVFPATGELLGTAGNPETIPVSSLLVEQIPGGPFVPLALGDPVEVFRKTAPSAADGDDFSHNYRITIPFVRPDTYTGTINYVATTL
ncbi:hypothetical protein [Streptosporangium roseum]|nr:hypothetical protein [Streptosporangium roseum]